MQRDYKVGSNGYNILLGTEIVDELETTWSRRIFLSFIFRQYREASAEETALYDW